MEMKIEDKVEHLHGVRSSACSSGWHARPSTRYKQSKSSSLDLVVAAAVGRPSSTIEVAGVENLSTKDEISTFYKLQIEVQTSAEHVQDLDLLA